MMKKVKCPLCRFQGSTYGSMLIHFGGFHHEDMEKIPPESSWPEKRPPRSSEMTALMKRAVEIQAILDQVKPLYKELDGIVVDLANRGFRAGKHDGAVVVLVDNFEGKNTCFRATGIKRFELSIKKEAI